MQRQNNWRRHGGRGNNRGNYRSRGGRQNSNIVRNPLRQQWDSNGPLGRVRGNAMQIMDKYIILAKEATSDGDRVLAEACLQYAEHYQRMVSEHQGQFKSSDDAMGDDSYDDALPQRGAGIKNGENVRVMGRGVVRYLDEEGDGNESGENLPNFLTDGRKNASKGKLNDDDDME
ncbi:MAG: DUF4167 domain-containing protein [Alphaproteobacteria bacterium]